LGDFQIKPKKGRDTDRGLTEEGRKRLSEAGRKPKPSSQGRAIRANWQRLFIQRNPLREGEVYVRYTNLRKPTIQEVIVIASDSNQIEYSRDGINWKIAKRRNYHADKTR